MGVEFFATRRIEVEPGALESGEKGAILQRDRAIVDRQGVVELVRQTEPLVFPKPQ
jgi:hypothetical protein